MKAAKNVFWKNKIHDWGLRCIKKIILYAGMCLKKEKINIPVQIDKQKVTVPRGDCFNKDDIYENY